MLEPTKVMSETPWRRSRWWLVRAPDGSIWCETSDESEARQSMRSGDTLYKGWIREEFEYREVEETCQTEKDG